MFFPAEQTDYYRAAYLEPMFANGDGKFGTGFWIKKETTIISSPQGISSMWITVKNVKKSQGQRKMSKFQAGYSIKQQNG